MVKYRYNRNSTFYGLRLTPPAAGRRVAWSEMVPVPVAGTDSHLAGSTGLRLTPPAAGRRVIAFMINLC